MTHNKKADILKWYKKADEDILSAILLIEASPAILDNGCFHCQQAIEKYLKSYLIYQGEQIIKTHNLNLLREKCSVYDADFEKYNFESLNDYGVEIRYPDDFLVPTIDEVREFLQIAEDIKKLVLNKVDLS